MALCLTIVAVGLFVGVALSLAQSGALEPTTYALVGLVVILLGQGTTPYVHPFGAGLLLGLAYDTLEDGWYGSAIARSERFSYRARLFLKGTTAHTSQSSRLITRNILAAAAATAKRITLGSSGNNQGDATVRQGRA
jgi:hypothetical protein